MFVYARGAEWGGWLPRVRGQVGDDVGRERRRGGRGRDVRAGTAAQPSHGRRGASATDGLTPASPSRPTPRSIVKHVDELATLPAYYAD